MACAGKRARLLVLMLLNRMLLPPLLQRRSLRSISICCCRIFTARISGVRLCVSSMRLTAFISSDWRRAIRFARICDGGRRVAWGARGVSGPRGGSASVKWRAWRSASTRMRARLALSMAADMIACCVSIVGSDTADRTDIVEVTTMGAACSGERSSPGLELLARASQHNNSVSRAVLPPHTS